MSELVERVLTDVRGKLLDLTRRNRLLNFKESVKSIRIVDELPNEVFRILVDGEKSMQFLPLVMEDGLQVTLTETNIELPVANGQSVEKYTDTCLQTPFSDTVLERRCKKLHQESRTAIEETGSNLLHLAIGFLEWYEADDSAEKNRAPLILVPVKIEKSRLDKKSNCYSYILSYTGEDIETNLSLAEKLKTDFDLILPELGECNTTENYLEAVVNTVGHRKRWRVAREMVLGLFSFSKLLMYRDLDPSRWPALTGHQNVRAILAGRNEYESNEDRPYGEEYDLDRDSKAISLPLITDADSSQTSVIIDAVHHRENLVVEGPPGTGKSQTITNIIAAALHEGLSVLFVAEKKAALEVVRSRLDQAGLGDFCLELHSHKTQKGQLHNDIAKRILKKYRDTTTLDREMEDLAIERDRLLSYSNLVNSVVGPNGETVYDIFWTAERCRTEVGGCEVRFTVSNPLSLTRNQLNDRSNLLKDIARLRIDLPDEAMDVWKDFTPVNILPGDEMILAENFSELNKLIEAHHSNLCDYLTHYDCPLPTTVKGLWLLSKLNNLYLLCDLPYDFHQALAPILALPNTMDAIKKLDATIRKHHQQAQNAELALNCIGDLTPEDAKAIIDCVSALESVGFDNLTYKEIADLFDKQEQLCDLLDQLARVLEDLQEFFSTPLVSVVDSKQALNLHHVLSNMPFAPPVHCHAEHCMESTVSIFREARNKCESLGETFLNHGRFFLLRYLPKTDDLVSLARDLRKFRGSFFAIFSSQYRSLRRTAKTLLVDPKQLGAKDLIERIESVVDTIKEIDSVSSNQSYKLKLGTSYVGIDTDWDRLESHINWCQIFSTLVGSSGHAYQLAPRIQEIVTKLFSAAGLINTIHAGLESLGASDLLDCGARITDTLSTMTTQKDIFNATLKLLKSNKKLDSTSMKDLAVSANAYLFTIELQANLDNKLYCDLLGTEYSGMSTNTESLLRSATWLERLVIHGELTKDLQKWLLSGKTADKINIFTTFFDSNKQFWNNYLINFENILNYVKISPNNPLNYEYYFDNFVSLSKFVLKCIEHIGSITSWNDYCVLTESADSYGLTPINTAIGREKISPDESAAIYRYAVYEGMAREVMRQYPDLASFTRAKYEGIRERYASTDRMIMATARERVAYIASNRKIPNGIGYGPVKDHTDFALLKRELTKQKRHIPIRQLVRRAGGALQGLKPCFMMSPLSVAQYLDPNNISFDLVIMDEASQLKPEDALGAIARATQLIVVGDPKQLPPTSFFDRTDSGADDDEEAMAIQDTESILDICMTTYNKRRLRWHYRSVHESLIAFSNNRFYDDDLIIFPSPFGNNSNYGVHRHYIDGATYQKGRNRNEAEAVALAVVEHFRNNPVNTLGVATFNREQAELVSDILDRIQKEQPWLEQAIKNTEGTEEPFFIKNLENVQGDERDVIFVSTTYGPDKETGKVYQRFGPIAGETGWRRLNVIFTRAKKQLELFTSLRSADIKLGDSPSKGSIALKEYLDYAETGRLPDYGIIGGKEPDSDFEVSVAHHLHLHGFKTVAQVGVAGFFIDIGVQHPEREGEFILGVECDGATYHSAKSVRDRDRLRQEILKRKGWRIHRIWSTDWFKNRDIEVQRLVNVVRKALQEQSSVVTTDSGFQDAVSAAIASIKPSCQAVFEATESIKTKTEKATVAQPALELAPQKASLSLRDELLEYRLTNILPSFNDDSRGILRDEVLSRLIVHLPTTREDFYKAVPMKMRQKTDSRQMQYIDDILEIIDGYAY
ncbi:DUF4011 domain-containing protein [Geobacter sp. FeAm09]|uniref:DUF4011 domain-containing protein n=1 Tax=Geobacter sp. FeAm09 TaxID=2597769 RepID=UPI00143DEE2B|nr:DUF4011 domain-containing protein [Geobacter sp. FeAm09]